MNTKSPLRSLELRLDHLLDKLDGMAEAREKRKADEDFHASFNTAEMLDNQRKISELTAEWVKLARSLLK